MQHSNNREKLFCVVTINYNNAAGLERTIESVVNQTARKNIQYVLIDGNSTDGSVDIIKRYKNRIDNVLIEDDSGVYDAMNKGLKLSNGKWSIFMNSGDIFAGEDVVAAMIEKSSGNQDCIAIYGDTLLANSQLWPTKPVENVWKGMICSHQSIAIKTDHLKSINFDTNLRIAADYKTILSAYLSGFPFLKLENKPISQIEPVGISSAFEERTLERWLINKQLAKSDKSKARVNRFYSKLLRDGEGKSIDSNNDCNSDLSYVEKDLIFLVSMPRSGSTLLQRIIESSPFIESTGEPWIALPIISMYDQESIESLYDQGVLNTARSALKKELKIDNSIYIDAERSYLQSIYSSIMNNIESPYYLDKTPRYSLFIDKLYELLPNAKYIILKRNPLSIINSYCNTWAKNSLKLVANNKSFMNDFKKGFSNLIDFSKKNAENPNVLTIDYEELTSNSEKIKNRIDNFLGVSVNTTNFNKEKYKARSLGDPKTINKVQTILNKNVDPSIVAKSFTNLEYYRDIVKIIPPKVFDHYDINIENFLASINSNSNIDVIDKSPLNNDSNSGGISVIITSYNNSATILQAISSALNQTRPPEEIIVIDDFSSDDSPEKIKEFITANESKTKIRLIQNNGNKGVSTSRDIAIREANYNFITTLDGDDTFSPLKLKAELQAITRNRAKVAFSDIKILTTEGFQILNTRFYHKKSQNELLKALTTRSYPFPRDMLIEKQLYISAGGFMKGFNLFEDWMLKQKLSCADGPNGWVHSGVIGTLYDRKNPGLSNKTSIQLIYAQLKVLAINRDLIIENGLDWRPIFRNLLKLDTNTKLTELRNVINSDMDDSESCMYINHRMKKFYFSLGRLPANDANDDLITEAVNLHWGTMH